MGIFTKKNPVENRCRNHDEDGDDESDEETDEIVVVIQQKTKDKDYTVHEATATFIDGTEKEYVFDKMKRKSGAIVLYDYVGYSPSGFKSKATDLIPLDNLRDFDTTKRRSDSMEVPYKDKTTMPRSEAEELVEEKEKAKIIRQGY